MKLLLWLGLATLLMSFPQSARCSGTYANPTFLGTGSAGSGKVLEWPTSGLPAQWTSGGGGSGTVNSGTANYLAYYASTGTAVSAEEFLIAAQMPSLTGDVTNTAGSLATTLTAIDGNPISAASPTTNQVLTWNGTDWVPETPTSGTGTVGYGTSGQVPFYESAGYDIQGYTLSGDVSSPIPGVVDVNSIKGTPWSGTTPTDAQIPIYSNSLSEVVYNSISGDISLSDSGATSVLKVGGQALSGVASGSLLIGTGSGTLGLLSIGVTGEVPIVSGGTLVYAFPSGGTVQSFSSGNLSPLFTTSVSSSTTTPSQTFTLSNAAGDSWFGNASGSSGAPSYNTSAIPVIMGGTGLNGSSTGGANEFVKQTSSGGAFTVATITEADIQVNYKRHWVATFYENATTTGIDTQTLVVAPFANGNTSVTWVPKICTLYVNTPASGATTAQVIYSTAGNAAVGSGTSILSSALSESGTSNYETSTTSMASVTVASGNYVAANWTACAGTNGILTMEFDEQ